MVQASYLLYETLSNSFKQVVAPRGGLFSEFHQNPHNRLQQGEQTGRDQLESFEFTFGFSFVSVHSHYTHVIPDG